MPIHTKRTSISSINKADASGAGPKKAGLAPICNFISSQPIYSKIRSRVKYTNKISKEVTLFNITYTDDSLKEIDRLPGSHLYFLDDHLLGNRKFAKDLFNGMKGMKRVFQGAATVDSILNGNLIDLAAEAGMRSIFVGFESITEENLSRCNKLQNLNKDYTEVINKLHDLGIMINGSFVFGLDGDDQNVFKKTVEWAISKGITTSTM